MWVLFTKAFVKIELVRLRSINTSIPSILPGEQRHSSTPQIEEEQFTLDIIASSPEGDRVDDNISSAVIPRTVEQGLPSSPNQSFLAVTVDSSTLHPGSPDNSSSSGEWNRFSHATEGSRMSNIIRGFPTPPDILPPTGSSSAALGSYLPDDTSYPFTPFALPSPDHTPNTPGL